MRLKALTIKNFKGIDETGICIALAPITLLFGPNNIGKSTVLQALLLAREAFHGVIPDKIEAKQHGIELGSFKDYVYKNDLSRAIYIRFRFTVTPEDYNISSGVSAGIGDLLKKTVKSIDVEIPIQWHTELNRAEVSGYTMYVNGKKFAAIQQNSSDNAEESHKRSSLYVYDIAPFISEMNLEKLENMWSELSKSMPDANQIEESRVFFKSAQWKNFLKLYFESVPSILFQLSNFNHFLKQLGMPKSFLTKDWIEEIYEKAFYTIEDHHLAFIDSSDLIDIYKYILEEFPNDVAFITTVIKNNDNPHDIFKELINHFKDDLVSLKCLCKYLYSTYPAFWDYYKRINNINSEWFWKREASELEEDFRTIFSMPEGVRKEYCHKILIDDIIKSIPYSFAQNNPAESMSIMESSEVGSLKLYWGKKRYYSIDDYLFYQYFLAEWDYTPTNGVLYNRIHYKNPDGSLSIKEDLHSQVKYNYQLLRKELIYFHFPDCIGHPEFEPDIDVTFLSLFSWPFEKIGAYLDSLLYVGPLRKIPERGSKGLWFYELDAATSKSDWSDGMAAWDWMATASEQALAELNSKLHGKGSMETGFAVKRRQFIRLEKGSDVFNALIHDPKTGREDPDHSPLRTLLELPPSEVQLSMVDLQTGLETEPYSMGTGVSQVLPIVAASVAANGKLVLLEQPELHIHPKLQTTLGDLFLSAVNKDSMFVLETHSEHLMLRLLRRIRETTEGELPNGVPSTTVDDVAVNYIQKNSNDCTEAIAIPITPDGDFARSWPNGFFAERAEELF